MANMYDLRAYVRYDKKGRMIPGSLVLRHKKPSGNFKEIILPTTELQWAQPSIGTTTTTISPGTSTTTTTTTFAPITGLTEAMLVLELGQSNAVGRAPADPAHEVVVPTGVYEYRPDANQVKDLADPTGIPGDNSRATVRSLNPALGAKMVQLMGKPVIVTCAAVGNTAIDSWLNTSGSLYTTALSRWNAMKAYCVANSITVLGTYIHWLQGENDAATNMATDAYLSKLNSLTDLFSQDFQPNKVFVTRIGYGDAPLPDAYSDNIMLAQKELNFSKDEVIVSTYVPATFIEGDTCIAGNRVHYTVKGLNLVGEALGTAIHRLRTLNKKPILTEPVVALQDPPGYFDDIYNFRSLTPGVNNVDYNELFNRNNLTLSGGTIAFDGSYGLTVGSSAPLTPATPRTLTNTHDWSVELTLRLDSNTSSMVINGRSSGTWNEDWLWIDSAASINLKANGVTKSVALSGANFNQLTNLVITYAFATNTVNVYVNSALKATFTNWVFTSWKLEAFTRGYTASPSIPFLGKLERIRIVKKVLALWEFDRSPNINTPVDIDWNFPFNGTINEAQGDTTTSLLSFTTNLPVTPTFDADGLVTNSGQYLLLGQQFLAATNFTIETRVKFTAGSTIQYLCSQNTYRPGSLGGGGNFIWIDIQSNIIRLQGDVGYGYWASLTGYDWTQFHIFKFIQTNTTIQLLIDGVSKGIQTTSAAPYKIGMIAAGHPTQGFNFNGTMDYFNVKNSL